MNFEAAAREWMKGCSCSATGKPWECVECTQSYHGKLTSLVAEADKRAARSEAFRIELLQQRTTETDQLPPCPKCASKRLSPKVGETRHYPKGSGGPASWWFVSVTCANCLHEVKGIRINDSGQPSKEEMVTISAVWAAS